MIWIFLTLLSLAEARQTVGEIYAVGKVEGKPLYVQKTKVDTDAKGRSKLQSVILDAAGKTLMTETAEFEGFRMIRQTMEQRQKNEVYELEVSAKKIQIRRFSNQNGERKLIKEGEYEGDETVLTGPVSENFVGAHWKELLAGDTVEARFSVMEIADTIHFRFRKISSDKDGLTVEMKPSGMFIRMLAGIAGLSPIHMTLDNDHHIVRYTGRTPLIDADKKPVDGEIVYRPAREGEGL